MAIGTLISVEEYLSTVYEPECEYVEGEVVDRNVGELDHSALQMMVAAILYNQRREMRIHVFPEVRVQTGARRFRVPDITVLTQPGKGRIVREAPTSPSPEIWLTQHRRFGADDPFCEFTLRQVDHEAASVVRADR